MLEHFDGCAWQLESQDEWGMVELVWQDETSFRHKPRQVQAVGCEAHTEGYGFFNTQESCNSLLQLLMHVTGAELKFNKQELVHIMYLSVRKVWDLC